MTDFYAQLTPFYHLIHQDWHASVRLQGEQLSNLMEAEWPGSRGVLDVSSGIGTQAIGLAARGLRHVARKSAAPSAVLSLSRPLRFG